MNDGRFMIMNNGIFMLRNDIRMGWLILLQTGPGMNLEVRVRAGAVQLLKANLQMRAVRVINIFSIDERRDIIDFLLRPVVCPHVDRPPINMNAARVQGGIFGSRTKDGSNDELPIPSV